MSRSVVVIPIAIFMNWAVLMMAVVVVVVVVAMVAVVMSARLITIDNERKNVKEIEKSSWAKCWWHYHCPARKTNAHTQMSELVTCNINAAAAVMQVRHFAVWSGGKRNVSANTNTTISKFQREQMAKRSMEN